MTPPLDPPLDPPPPMDSPFFSNFFFSFGPPEPPFIFFSSIILLCSSLYFHCFCSLFSIIEGRAVVLVATWA